MDVNLVELIAGTGGTLGLAVFAIAVLQRTWREQAARAKEDRELLIEVVQRNTEAWVAATTTMAAIAERTAQNASDLRRIREMLGRGNRSGAASERER